MIANPPFKNISATPNPAHSLAPSQFAVSLQNHLNEAPKPDNLIFGEIQVLLAEKRTALASMRTGIAVFALPLSVLRVLIATSRYYNFGKVMPLLAPLLLLNLGLVVLGS
jgi:hypothetical protein